MKTKYIIQAFRNAATPAACLAAWQNRGTRRNLATLKKYTAPDYPCRPCNFPASPTVADWRKALANDPAFRAGVPELSSPEADAALLWITGSKSPEVLNYWQGREFLKHRGWYTADDSIGCTMETCAVRLARFPDLIFYATRDSDNEDLCVRLEEWEEIDFSDCESDYHATDAVEDAARSLIRSYDHTTERAAERCRDEFEKDQREREIEENREELKGIRKSARRLIGELRELCPTLGAYPATADALRGALRGMLRNRARLVSRNSELLNA